MEKEKVVEMLSKSYGLDEKQIKPEIIEYFCNRKIPNQTIKRIKNVSSMPMSKIIKDRSDGMTYKRISEKYKISAARIARVINEYYIIKKEDMCNLDFLDRENDEKEGEER